MLCLPLLAQQIDPLGGIPGWATFVVQGGVLAWLLFVHIPAKDKQMKEFYDSKEKSDREQMEKYKASLDAVVKHCEDENDKVASMFREFMGLRHARS